MTNNVTLLLSDFCSLSDSDKMDAIAAIKDMELKMELNHMADEGASESAQNIYKICRTMSVKDIMTLVSMLGKHLTIEQKVDCWMG